MNKLLIDNSLDMLICQHILKSGTTPNGITFNQRFWVVEAMRKFALRHSITNDEHNVWIVNACTGSGKTNLGFEMIIQDIYISYLLDEKSIHGFVAPRILLSNQQMKDFAEYFKQWYPDLYEKTDIRYVHSGKTPTTGGNHLEIVDGSGAIKPYKFGKSKDHCVVIFCYESFKGKKDSKRAYEFFKKTVSANKNRGLNVTCGSLILDEAHNYDKNFELLTGYRKNDKIISESVKFKDDNFRLLFKDITCMTGTPGEFQCLMSQDDKFKKDFLIPVTYKYAIGMDWILCPEVFVILNLYNLENALTHAVISAYEREKAAHPDEPVHLLVNCLDRTIAMNTVKKVWEYIQNNNINCKVFSLHGADDDLKPTEDGVEYKDSELIKAKVCGGEYDDVKYGGIDKDYPNQDVIVMQVKMISEGMNINSFNAVVVTSTNEVNIIQQIGRAVRKFFGKKHVSVYCVCDNYSDVWDVFRPLIKEGLDLGKILGGVKKLDEPTPTTITKPGRVVFKESDWDAIHKQDLIMDLEKMMTYSEAKDSIDRSIQNTSTNEFVSFMEKYPLPGSGKIAVAQEEPAESTTKSTGGSRTKNTGAEKEKSAKSSGKQKKAAEDKKRAYMRFLYKRIKCLIDTNPQWNKEFIPNMGDLDIVHKMLKDAVCYYYIDKPNEDDAKMLKRAIDIVCNQKVKELFKNGTEEEEDDE